MNKSRSLSEFEKLLLGNSVHIPCKYYTIDDFSFNGMSFIHYNARSLGANISRVRESFQRLSLTFYIIVISETWTKANCLYYQLPNYSLFYTDKSLKQGGGVALYVNNKFNCNTIKNMSYENLGFFEVIIIQNHSGIIGTLSEHCFF